MGSRSQNKRPLSVVPPPSSPSNRKDNIDEIPIDKRRKVNTAPDLATVGDPASTASSECGGIEFTLEDVEAILNEMMKGKTNFDYKGKCEQITEYVKKLRLKEEADKLAALDSHRREQDARIAAESAQASLSNELNKTREELSSANQTISSVNEIYKRLQDYNTSLQQYNSKLQTQVALRYSRASLEEAIKQKEALVEEVASLRVELQQVRDDRDRQLLQVQTLSAEVVKYQESTGKISAELDNLMF